MEGFEGMFLPDSMTANSQQEVRSPRQIYSFSDGGSNATPGVVFLGTDGYFQLRGGFSGLKIAVDGDPVTRDVELNDWFPAPRSGKVTFSGASFSGTCQVVWHPNQTSLVTSAGSRG